MRLGVLDSCHMKRWIRKLTGILLKMGTWGYW